MKLFYSKIKKIFLLVSLAILSFQCSDEKHPVPNVEVYVSVDNVTLSQIGIGTAAYYNGEAGIRGIIIYHESQNTYFAYERLCTYYPSDDCAIEIDTDNEIVAKCPCCGSEFSLWTGDVLKAPAKWYLKRYRTNLSGGRLYITN
jgi:nitrite reductase/ring-hydroxylating ferredoxin subunit